MALSHKRKEFDSSTITVRAQTGPMIVPRAIYLILPFLFLLPTTSSAEWSCIDLLRDARNIVYEKLGILPHGISKYVVPPNATCDKIWNAYRMDGAEHAAFEIYGENGQILATSGIVSSGSSTYVGAKVLSEAFFSTLKNAHDLNLNHAKWRVRTIHNHPSGFTHSAADVRAAMAYKALLERMGYVDATFSMDVMFSSRGVSSFDLTPDISVQNRSYWNNVPNDQATARTRAAFIHNSGILQKAVEEKFAIRTTDKFPSELEVIFKASAQKKQSYAALYSSGKNAADTSKNAGDNSLVGPLKTDLTMIGGLLHFLDDPDVTALLEQIEKNSEKLHVLVAPMRPTDYQTFLQTAVDLRALLDHLDFRSDIVFSYRSTPETLKEFTLPYDFRMDGVKLESTLTDALKNLE